MQYVEQYARLFEPVASPRVARAHHHLARPRWVMVFAEIQRVFGVL